MDVPGSSPGGCIIFEELSMKLSVSYWFYLLAGLGIWGAIPIVLFDNIILIIIGCFIVSTRWIGYVSAWYLEKRENEIHLGKK